ncbi:MAG: hypothetical protein AAFQ57_03840 [Cyanobacteria bacterium J06626_14]
MESPSSTQLPDNSVKSTRRGDRNGWRLEVANVGKREMSNLGKST